MPKCIACSNTEDFEHLQDIASATARTFTLQRCKICGLRYVFCQMEGETQACYFVPLSETDADTLLADWSEEALLALAQARPCLEKSADGEVKKVQGPAVCAALRG